MPGAAVIHRLLPVFESNLCCRRFGRVGTSWAGNRRKLIGTVMCMANILAMFFLSFAAMGMTTDAGLLQSTYWVHGLLKVPLPPALKIPDGHLVIHTYVGSNMHFETASCEGSVPEEACRKVLEQAGFVEETAGAYKKAAWWVDTDSCGEDLFHNVPKHVLASRLATDTKYCQTCKDSQMTNSALILGVVGQFATLTTDLQRSTRYGDMNCQKVFGVLSNLISLASSLIAMSAFYHSCFKNLPPDMFGADIEWSIGAGFLCLFFSTLVKVPDAVAHLLIQTPEKRWKVPVGSIDELADYMDLEEAATPRMKSAEDQDTPLGLDDEVSIESEAPIQSEAPVEHANDSQRVVEAGKEEDGNEAPEEVLAAV